MSAYYHTEAWLLATRPIGEADRLVTLYTKDLGRIDALAKGTRLAKSKLKGHLNLFSRVRVLLTSGKELWRIIDVEQIHEKGELINLLYVQEFAEFFKRAVSHSLPDQELWGAIEKCGDLQTYEQLQRMKYDVLSVLGMSPEGGASVDEALLANHMVY